MRKFFAQTSDIFGIPTAQTLYFLVIFIGAENTTFLQKTSGEIQLCKNFYT